MISSQLIVEALSKIEKESGVSLAAYTPQDLKITSKGTEHNELFSEVVRAINEDGTVQKYKGNCYCYVKDSGRERILLECGANDKAVLVAKMAKLQLEQILEMNSESYDMSNFFKNLLLDNLLIVDIYSQANRLHINTKARRMAFLVQTEKPASESAVSVVRSILEDAENNFVTIIGEKSIVIVREVKEDEKEADMQAFANTVADMLNMELMDKVTVAYGNMAKEIREVANSYKEARVALAVGKIFNPERNVISYNSLGIGRLIHQLPLPMCKMFIEEIFRDNSPESFDDETIQTINEFFSNSLNVSETSRKLYIHRNTLVYRLDKIQKMTDLDLRKFDDAITFKLALMVTKYMKYMENASDGKRRV